MQPFFSTKAKRRTSRPIAYTLNTLNLLGPVLLALAVVLLGMAGCGAWQPAERHWLSLAAVLRVTAALCIRLIWGLAIYRIRKKPANEAGR